MWGLVATAGLDEDRPDVMFLGKFGDDVGRCQQACALVPECVSYRYNAKEETILLI